MLQRPVPRSDSIGRLTGVAVAFLLVAAPQWVEAKSSTSFSASASITTGSLLHIHNRRGDIVVRSGTGNLVQVSAQVHASTDQGDMSGRYTPAEIMAYVERKAPIEQKDGNVHIGAMLHEDFHLGVQIDYQIVAPPGVVLEIESELGRLEVHGVGQPIKINKTSGSVIVVEPAGALKVESTDAALQVFGTPTDEWSLKSTYGGVEVVLPQGFVFELDAETKQGALQSEFPLGEHEPGRFEGKINGESGPRVHLRSETGAIAIWRR